MQILMQFMDLFSTGENVNDVFILINWKFPHVF